MDHSKYKFPTNGKGRLKDYPTRDKGSLEDKEEGESLLAESVLKLAEIQERLYASDRHSILVIFQAMDAAGKDGTIRHVMSGINPQGCHVTSFKAPSSEELDHTYLWRCMKALPERGKIGVFNRSYYEEVLVVRVHPEFLDSQKLPYTVDLTKDRFWNMRFEEINNFERYLAENGVTIIKFFLNVSKDEQKERFLERIEDPAKNWKFSATDIKEREHWDEYMEAYEDMLRHTSTDVAPWYVIPADKKWYMRTLVSDILVDRMEELDLRYPTPKEEQMQALQEAADLLKNED